MASGSSSQKGAKVTVSASGGIITGLTLASSTRWNSDNGAYTLPPALQERQYAKSEFITATGSTTFGSSGSGCYKIVGESSGASNACAYVSWYPDWCSGASGGSGNSSYVSCVTNTTYFGVFSGHTSTQEAKIGKIFVGQGGTTKDTVQFGEMYAVYNTNIDNYQSGLITTGGGYYGWEGIGVDFRGETINPIAAAYGYNLRYGQQHYNQMIVDTPTTGCGKIGYMSGSISIAQQQCFVTASALTDYAWNYGGEGSASQGIGSLMIGGSIISNTGNAKPAMFIDRWHSGNWVNHVVSNFTAGGVARTNQVLYAFEFGSNNQANGGNVLTGSIDNVAGAIYSGTWPVGFGSLYWDSYANGWIFSSGVYQMYGAGVPVDGTTGDNKTTPGSLYIDTTNGEIYIETGIISSPVWNRLARVTSGTFANKPTSPYTGQQYYVTDLGSGINIVYNGSKWIPVGGSALIYNDAASHSATCTGSEQHLYAVTIPAGLLSTTGALEFNVLYAFTGTNGTKVALIRHSSASGGTAGTAYINASFGGSASTIQLTARKVLFNAGSLSSQISSGSSVGGYGTTTSGSLTSGSINTANTSYLNFNVTGSSTSDTCGTQIIQVWWHE